MQRRLTRQTVRLVGMLLSALWLGSSGQSAAWERPQEIAHPTLTPTFISWQPHVPYERLTLTVAVPTGRVVRTDFGPGQPIALDIVDAQGKVLPDGPYTYELVVTPMLDPSVTAALAQERDDEKRRALIEALQEQGSLPRHPVTQTGFFTITKGTIASSSAER